VYTSPGGRKPGGSGGGKSVGIAARVASRVSSIRFRRTPGNSTPGGRFDKSVGRSGTRRLLMSFKPRDIHRKSNVLLGQGSNQDKDRRARGWIGDLIAEGVVKLVFLSITVAYDEGLGVGGWRDSTGQDRSAAATGTQVRVAWALAAS
jgi:hypothetical protein